MESSLQNLDKEEVKEFFKHACFVINNNKKKENAEQELYRQINKIKNAPKRWILEKEIKGLHEKIGKVLSAEKQLLGYDNESTVVRQLNSTIKLLEKQMAIAREEKDKALTENRQRINEIYNSISNIKSRISEISKKKVKKKAAKNKTKKPSKQTI